MVCLIMCADPVDVWYRICAQRKGALRDVAALQLSMQLILQHGHDVLNKRMHERPSPASLYCTVFFAGGIMTSYQMKTMQPEKAAETKPTNDPFSDLDPLWKLKD